MMLAENPPFLPLLRPFKREYACFGHNSPSYCCQHAVSIHIIGKISKPNFYPCSGNTNGSHYKGPSFLGLHTKNMLNPGTNSGTSTVSLFLSLRKFFVAATFSLQMFTESLLLEGVNLFRRAIGRIRPYRMTAIPEIQQFLENITVRWL